MQYFNNFLKSSKLNSLCHKGLKIGSLKIRYFRPFPSEEIRDTLKNNQKIGVIDRAVSYGHEGPFFSEIKSALYGSSIPMYGFIAGLGGRDVSLLDIESMAKIMQQEKPKNLIWIGVKDVC